MEDGFKLWDTLQFESVLYHSNKWPIPFKKVKVMKDKTEGFFQTEGDRRSDN